MGNKEVKNKISVDELLRRKQERNEASKGNTRTNYQTRNKQIAIRHGQNTEDNLLGEAQIDLQHRLLEEEEKAIARFNNNYVALTDSVIASLDAQADEEAAQIESADDLVFETTVEVLPIGEVKQLPPRKSRFGNRLPGGTETKSLEASEDRSSEKKNMFDV